MTESDTGLPEKVIKVEDLIGSLSDREREQVADKLDIPEVQSGYLNYYDVCILFGRLDWRSLDAGLARSFARAIVTEKGLPLQEVGGRFILNYMNR